MDINEAIVNRRSIREYTTQSVDDETIHRLIEAAVRAPSAVNRQPWIFTVIRDQGVLDQISRLAKAHMLSGGHADQFRARLTDPDFQIFYHAPVLVVISAAEQGPWIVEDCALAAENLMLAAHALGLGTCWIGLAQGYLNTPEGKTLVGLPAEAAPVAPLIVGHPRSVALDVPRKAPDVRRIG